MPDDQDAFFAQIAVREGLVTADQVDECLAEQKSWPPGRPVPRIGELMASKGYLSGDQACPEG